MNNELDGMRKEEVMAYFVQPWLI